ncbi:hypothetical protein ABFU65_11030 [Xanthomonas campestris pv. raphani]|uniref:hypothetical protein n=1 Tax=Xanthomonas TaxID=338 RepID=UPI001C4973A8|nr:MULTISPECIES: hypothetical protein [Xanthomonas]MBV6786114.1 hypothetical protein [Xanthomonas campestris pv. uppalii]MEA9654879.1 hypothetical protein [Xanthomonas campestris pv. raphani]
MAEIKTGKLFGGLGNGNDLPDHWIGQGVWKVPGSELFSIYAPRSFFHGVDRIVVWTDVEMPQDLFEGMQSWHREMYRGDLVEAQRTLVRESMAAAASYTNVIMVAGYAALFAFWSQGKDWLTKPTLLAAGISIAVSVALFVAWELFGMITRSALNLALANAVNRPNEFASRIAAHRDNVGALTERFRYVWFGVVGCAMGSAVLGFGILLSGFVHGLWLHYSG